MKRFLFILSTTFFSLTSFAQAPSIGDVKGTTDEPGNVRSVYQKSLIQARYFNNNSLMGSVVTDFSGYGFSLSTELAKKFLSKSYWTVRASVGSFGFYEKYSTQLASVEGGLLRVLHNFRDYDGENSIYARINSGPFLGLIGTIGNDNPTLTSRNEMGFGNSSYNNLTRNSFDADYFTFGMKSNLKLGYMVNVFEDYSFTFETGLAHYYIGKSLTNQHNFFSPEFTLGIKKQNLLEW